MPGFDPDLVCERLKTGSYVYVEDKELLLRVTALGDSGLNKLKIDYANRSTCAVPSPLVGRCPELGGSSDS